LECLQGKNCPSCERDAQNLAITADVATAKAIIPYFKSAGYARNDIINGQYIITCVIVWVQTERFLATLGKPSARGKDRGSFLFFLYPFHVHHFTLLIIFSICCIPCQVARLMVAQSKKNQDPPTV